MSSPINYPAWSVHEIISKACLNLSKIVQTCTKWSKLAFLNLQRFLFQWNVVYVCMKEICQKEDFCQSFWISWKLEMFSKTYLKLSKLVQTCSKLSKLVQTCPNWVFIDFLNFSILSFKEIFQKRSNHSELLLKTYLNLSEFVQNGRNYSKVVINRLP